MDRGNKCALCREKITCTDCGRIKPQYNFAAEISEPCRTERASNSPQEITNQSPYKQSPSQTICICKQSCWEWILSFLGVGGKLPECCKDRPLTAWESGEVAREAVTSKVQQVVQRISGRAKLGHVRRSSSVNLREDQKQEAPRYFGEVTDEEDKRIDIDDQTDQEKDSFQGKKKEVRSLSTSRGRSRHRKNSQAKAKSTAQEGQNGRTSLTSRDVGEGITSSESATKDRKVRSRSRSRSTSKVFNPFQRRRSICRCHTLGYSKSPLCPPLPCPAYSRSQSKVCSSNLPEEAQSTDPAGDGAGCAGRDAAHTDKDSQPLENAACPQLKRSNSMPCKPCIGSCVSRKSTRPCKCVPVACFQPKLPCCSSSFHSTLMRSPVLRVSMLPTPSPCCRPCVVSTGRPKCRQFNCPSSSECSAKKSRSPRPCCCTFKSSYCSPPPHCKSCCLPKTISPCLDMKSPCGAGTCQLGNKPPVCFCPPFCTKPCCLPIARKFTVFPYCPRPDTSSRRYFSVPSCSLRTSCPCPPGSSCTCPKSKPFHLPCCSAGTNFGFNMACSTPTVMSYIKAKQNDIICNKLLAKYGFALTPPQNFIPSCYGIPSEGICPSWPCQTNLGGCGSVIGCRSCLPTVGRQPSVNNEIQDKSNSRQRPTSEDCTGLDQFIQFNTSPSEKKSVSKFELSKQGRRK